MITEIDMDYYCTLKEVSSPVTRTELEEIDFYAYDVNDIYKFDEDYYLRYNKYYFKIVGYSSLKTFLNVYASDNYDLIINEIQNGFDMRYMDYSIIWWAIDKGPEVEPILMAFVQNCINGIHGYANYRKSQLIFYKILVGKFSQELKNTCFKLIKGFAYQHLIKLDDNFKKQVLNSDKLIINSDLQLNLKNVSHYIENPDTIKRIKEFKRNPFDGDLDRFFGIDSFIF